MCDSCFYCNRVNIPIKDFACLDCRTKKQDDNCLKCKNKNECKKENIREPSCECCENYCYEFTSKGDDLYCGKTKFDLFQIRSTSYGLHVLAVSCKYFKLNKKLLEGEE